MIRSLKVILLLLLFTKAQTTFSQTAFNYENDFKKILAKTKDQNDKLYYNRLLKRFEVNDKTLTDFEVLALLIGFTAKPVYWPYKDLETERKIFDLNDDGKYQAAMDSANVFLATHPLSVKVLFEKAWAFHKLNNDDSANYYSYKGRSIFNAMSSTGNGKSTKTPIFALGPADGQDYIRKHVGGEIGGADIGMMGSARENENFIDILEVVPRNGSSAYKLYFIIQHAVKKMFSEEDLKIFDKEEKKKDN